MSDWQPGLYLAFEKERTQPAIDLAARIASDGPKRIIDIGCGPGNSTSVIKARWPQAAIVGLDKSPAMIGEAKSRHGGIEWICADATGDLTWLGKFDIVFSNAAIQWMPDQESLLPRLCGMLQANGTLAVQVPYTKHMPVRIELEKLAAREKWKDHFLGMETTYSSHAAVFYYDVLCGLTDTIELWQTDYHHAMRTHRDIVHWYSGTGLRPYLDCLRGETLQAEFVAEYEAAIQKAYPMRADRSILFAFSRIFFVATKAD